MTRYRVPVSAKLLEDRIYWRPVEGFRFISADGPRAGHPGVTICTFEDDNAPADLEGRLVEPLFRQELPDVTSREPSFVGTVTITGYELISEE